MGSYPKAYIIYGFAIGGEGFDAGDDESLDCPQDVIDDWEKVYADKKGYPEPTVDYDSSPEAKEEHRAYWSQKREVVKTAKGNIVSSGDLCNGVTTHYVTHAGAWIKSDWDGPTEITPERIAPKPEWNTELKEFCDLLGIPWQQPKTMIICAFG